MPTSRASVILAVLLALELVPLIASWLFAAALTGPAGFWGTWSRANGYAALAGFATAGMYAACWLLTLRAARSAGSARGFGVAVCGLGIAASALGAIRVAAELLSSPHRTSSGGATNSLGEAFSGFWVYAVLVVMALISALAMRARTSLARSTATVALTVASCGGALLAFVMLSDADGLSPRFILVALALVVVPFTALGLVACEHGAAPVSTPDNGKRG